MTLALRRAIFLYGKRHPDDLRSSLRAHPWFAEHRPLLENVMIPTHVVTKSHQIASLNRKANSRLSQCPGDRRPRSGRTG
jgi:hypothetical protein